ncbi:glycosyltransferase family 4 protein [Patescibacteria group bacterium]
MKILYIVFKYPLYHGGSYFQEFLNSISKKVKNISLIAFLFPKTKFSNPKNINFFSLPIINLPILDESLFMLSSFVKVFFSSNFSSLDLINCIGPRGLLAGWYLKKRYKIPLVCTIEMLNNNKGFRNKLTNFFSRFLLTNAPIDKYICWASFYKKQLISWGISASKIQDIFPGIDIKKYHPKINGKDIKLKYSPKNPLIVFAKPLYLHHIRAVKLLIKSIAILKPKIKINLLLGDGQGKKQIEIYAKNQKVLNQIKFMPQVSFSQIPNYLAAADLIVLPFTYEPTVSRSLLEALAIGKPVITSFKDEFRTILTHKKNVIFTKNSPSQIAKKVEEILKNRKLSKKLSKNAVYLIQNNYSQKLAVQKTITCYRKVLKHG